MKLRPLRDRVVVERIDPEAKSACSIIPDSAQEKPSQGKHGGSDGTVAGMVEHLQSELADHLNSLSSNTRGLSLTRRQRQVLQLLVSGKSNKEIARNLNLGEGTVKIHMTALFRNLGVANRAAAAVVGARSKAVNFH